MVAISNPERKSGISILGDVPWGTHLCYFYQTKQDLIDILVPYFKAGLESNEFCMWVVSEPLTVEEARAELQRAVKELDQYDKKGQIELLHFSQWYTRAGKFDPDKVLRGCLDKERQARENGFEGLRISGSTIWTEHEEWNSFSDYEATVNNGIHNYHMLAICSYSLDKCDPQEIMDVFGTHQFALVGRDGKQAMIESTERKRAEEALRESEEKHRTLFETMTQGVVYQNAEGHIISANRAAERLLGLTLAQMLGRTSTDPRWKAIHEDGSDFPGDTHPAMIALKTGKEVSHVMGVFRPGANEYIWINIHAVPQFRPGETKPYQVYTTFDGITERKRAEAALRQANAYNRSLIEASLDPLVTIAPDGKITDVNNATEKVTGRSRRQLIGTDFSDYFTDPGKARTGYKQVFREGLVQDYELEIRHRDGQVTPVLYNASVYRDEAGDVIGVFAAARDIAGRKRAEEERLTYLRLLEQSEQKYRSRFEESFDGLFITSPEGKILDMNRKGIALFGYKTKEEVCSLDLEKDVYADPLDRKRILARVGAEGSSEYEVVVKKKNGERMLTHCSLTAERDEQGVIISYRGIIRDITETKRAEEALRESEERFRSLVENATVGIYRTTPDGHILMANPALVRMLEFDSFEELAARNLECGGFEPSYPRRVFRERIEREGQVVGLEAAWIRRDGSVIFVRESGRAVRADDGRVLYYDGIVEDITTRRHAEEAMRRLSGRLLRLQDEERRRIARELHETAAQSLAGLAINLNMVKDSAAHLSPRASACLVESLELAEQCSREIRTLSYLLHPPLVDEAGLAPALRWYTAGFAQRSGIAVHVDVSLELGRLPSEVELALYRIVQEALTNIHRHSGSKTARICLERWPNGIVLTVADEGHGFPSAALGIAGPESTDIGVGIPGMRERLRQLGGRLHIQTGSRGTTLRAILPFGEVTNGQTTHPAGG
jgi:PAS domain S-box-containing protein